MCSVDFVVIIPARYASTRLPGKPLLEIAGKPMVRHVHECAVASGAGRVVVATDDERIYHAATGFGAEVVMTSAHHRSGTERLSEVVDHLQLSDSTVVVNLQGDEPLMPASLVCQVATVLHHHSAAAVATLSTPLEGIAEIFDPHVVKVVRDAQGYALYFSRAPIPWNRDDFTFWINGAISPPVAPIPTQKQEPREQYRGMYQRHIGLYAYRAGFIREYPTLPPSSLEQIESLEQLRVLYHGRRIYVDEATALPGPGVDIPADLDRVRTLLSQ
ncbi:3-deoxy-manno-octulosonate cytidylyltransferase [Gammaproteobacteria bacterium]